MKDPGQPVERGRRRRRRRARGEGGRGFSWLLPHLFTTGNLAAGFYAIVKATSGDLDRAALAIFVAGIFDFLDGRLARLSGATSRFGAEYDSIADTVSFGVAPAIIAFSAGALQQLGWTGWVLAFMFTACAALRLARFNVTPARYRGRFVGLPSPTAAGMVAASVWFAGFMQSSGLPLRTPPTFAGFGVAALGLLMVSPIPYRSFKDIRIRGSQRSIVLAVLGFGVLLSKPAVTFFVVILFYVLSGPFELYWRWRTGQELEPIPPPEPIPGEDTRGSAP